MRAEQVLFFAVPEAGALAMDADLPVAEFVTMALAAQSVRFGEGNEIAGNQSQHVAITQIMAIKTPALAFGVVKDDVVVHVDQFPALRVRYDIGVTIVAREDAVREGGRWHREGHAFFRPALVLFDLFLHYQVALTVKELFDPGTYAIGWQTDQSGARNKQKQIFSHGDLHAMNWF
jgi:hypothetical protein